MHRNAPTLLHRDLRFEKDNNRPLKEIMTHTNLITVKAGTSLQDAEKILQNHKIEKLPVVADDNVSRASHAASMACSS